jgi:hypothetical protein
LFYSDNTIIFVINITEMAVLLFEEVTNPLTYEERQLVRPMMRGLLEHKGQANAITAKDIILGFSQSPKWRDIKLNGARVRKIIHHIRANNLVWGVCSSKKGYYVAATQQELKDNCISLRQRMASMKYVLDAMERQYIERYGEAP